MARTKSLGLKLLFRVRDDLTQEAKVESELFREEHALKGVTNEGDRLTA